MAQTLLGNVKGPKGDTGAQGPQGEQGPTGAQGPQGETGPANTAFITDAFSTSQAYNAGDYCIYNNTLYRFAEDKAAGEWDDSKVMSTLIGTELSGLNSSIQDMPDTLFTVYGTYSGDCNDIDQPGLFGSVVNRDAINGPEMYCYLLVLVYRSDTGDTNITQIAFPYMSNGIKTRYRSNGIWSSWVSV